MFFLFLAVSVFASQDLTSEVQLFYQDPQSYMQKPIVKRNRQGEVVELKHELLANISSEETYFLKLQERKNFFALNHRFVGKKLPVEPGANDRAENLLNRTDLIKNPYEMHNHGLSTAELKESPWSGDYWAVYKGVLGSRYLDPSFPWVQDWSQLYAYIQQFPFFEIFQGGNEDKIDALSASEKYDLIMGDFQGTLTKNMWDQGREYYDAYGKVETWMGICHGWAAAAIAVPRPVSSIQVAAYDGSRLLTLRPSEIKGLASYLWATTPYKSFFIGGRCNHKDVPQDEFGRPTAAECRDTNPATWHIAIVNAIGVDKKSFVMDATMDYEVWNQPVHGYSIKYFNPISKKEVGTPEQATVLLADWTEDPFKRFRSKKAKSVMGVAMEVKYVTEESANNRDFDTSDYDSIFTATYMYDLEMDAQNRIVGGEWMNLQHPDFLWTPAKEATPINYEDTLIKSDWLNGMPAAKDWQESAHWASQGGRVLSKAINKMILWSRSTE